MSNDNELVVTGRLENWLIGADFGTEVILYGQIYDDALKRFTDGTVIHTSGAEKTRTAWREGDVVETRNSTYLLGKRAHHGTRIGVSDAGIELITDSNEE